MTKVKDFFKKIGSFIKKYKIPFILCLAVIVVIIVIVSLVPDKKAKYEDYMKTMGKDFYENFYYKQLNGGKADTTSFLSKYSAIGIKVNLDNLGRYTNSNDDMIKELKDCDGEKTRAVIYPQDPYGKTDYKLEVELDCKGIKSGNNSAKK